MPLTADLGAKLDASALVQTLLHDLTSSAGDLNAIADPVDPDQLASASGAGTSFLPAPILDAVGRFAGVELPGVEIPGTIQRIEDTLTAIEQLTSRDLGADLSTLAQQLTTELETANQQGIPGTILNVVDLLGGSPTLSAVRPLGSTLLGGASGLGLPPALAEYLPAFVSTIRVVAGLMVYETVLAEGERLTGLVATLFAADSARRRAEALGAAIRLGDGQLAQALTAAAPDDTDRLDSLVAAVENAAALLEDLGDYVARGMGFGEATLVHFDLTAAQADIATAGALLRDADLTSLQRVIQSLAATAQPVLASLDPGAASARSLEEVLQLAEAQADQAATAIRNLDASVLVSPLSDGIARITAPLQDFSQLVTRVVTEVRAALEQVRAAIAALPIDDLASAIRTALEPVTRALEFIQGLVEDIRVTLETGAQTAVDALGTVEGAVDQFQQQISDLFEEARQFVDGLHLDQVISSISDAVNAFVGVLQQAQMKPYFDTAASAIDAAADVISSVPLDLLPDSMHSDLDAAFAPVREVNADAVESQIESLLQIGPDGEFQLRGDLEQALATIQQKFDALLDLLDEHHPSRYLQQIDDQLSSLATRIQSLAPQLTLEPVQQAIAQVKSALGSFDLAAVLEPVQAVFDRAMQALDAYSPAMLLAPLQARVAEARQKLLDTLHVADWKPTLDHLASLGLARLDVLDPAALERLLTSLLESLRQEAQQLPDIGVGNWLGMIVTGMMRGSNLRIGASSIGSVLRWAGGSASASTELSARAANIADAVATASREVSGFDPTALAPLIADVTAVRTAAQSLASGLTAGSAQQLRLHAASARLDATATFGDLAANRSRYLDLLHAAAGLADVLRRTGMSEADVAVNQLRAAFAPLTPLLERVRLLTTFLGLGGAHGGLGAALRSALEVATPARLSSLFSRLVAALRDRLKTLADQVLTPIRAAIDDLTKLIDLFDLQPVIDAVQGVFDEVRAQLLAFSPTELLHDQLAAFTQLQQTLLDFDPLGPILEVLDTLRDTAARIVGKLSARKLLEAPLAIYDAVVNALRQLSIDTLLTPVLDVLDCIARDVDQGLDTTVEAFKRLQQALPPPGGGGASASVSVSVA